MVTNSEARKGVKEMKLSEVRAKVKEKILQLQNEQPIFLAYVIVKLIKAEPPEIEFISGAEGTFPRDSLDQLLTNADKVKEEIKKMASARENSDISE